jgi:hypothetical protein
MLRVRLITSCKSLIFARSADRARHHRLTHQFAAPLRPERGEYDRIEYGRLPVKYAIFVIVLCSSRFHVAATWRANGAPPSTESRRHPERESVVAVFTGGSVNIPSPGIFAGGVSASPQFNRAVRRRAPALGRFGGARWWFGWWDDFTDFRTEATLGGGVGPAVVGVSV